MRKDSKDSLEKMIRFLSGIGITVQQESNVNGFIPGVDIRKGAVLAFNAAQMEGVGDLLHEAGHLAVIPSMFRGEVFGDIDAALMEASSEYVKTHPIMIPGTYEEDPVIRALIQASEQEAIAWSYAAALEIGIEPTVVFHPKSFGGDNEEVLLGLQIKQHAGINGMSAARMTTRQMFPKMIRWMQV